MRKIKCKITYKLSCNNIKPASIIDKAEIVLLSIHAFLVVIFNNQDLY